MLSKRGRFASPDCILMFRLIFCLYLSSMIMPNATRITPTCPYTYSRPTLRRFTSVGSRRQGSGKGYGEQNQRPTRRDNASSCAAQARQGAKSANLQAFHPLRPLGRRLWAQEGICRRSKVPCTPSNLEPRWCTVKQIAVAYTPCLMSRP